MIDYNADVEYRHLIENIKVPDNLLKVNDLKQTYSAAKVMLDRTEQFKKTQKDRTSL